MRLANVSGRAHLVVDGRLVDVERASGGRLPADPMAIIAQLDALGDLGVPDDAPALDEAPASPPPYRGPRRSSRSASTTAAMRRSRVCSFPDEPVVFAKLPSALCGATDDIVIPAGRSRVDWEVELVVAIGRRGRRIAEADAWSHVAGVTGGQDVSDREEQFRSLRQFTMAKSFDTYAPIGPVLVTPDELDEPRRRRAQLQGRRRGRAVEPHERPDLLRARARSPGSRAICTLEPGDLIFTGTPSGRR